VSLRTELQSIYDEYGRLDDQLIVDCARDHPNEYRKVHGRMTWDDTVAGELWRRYEAGQMRRSVRLIYRKAKGGRPAKSVRAWHATRTPTGEHTFRPTEEIAQDPFQRELLLREMRRDWEIFKARYHHLVEFFDLLREEGGAAA
jgi:hypothetical protein